MEHEGPLSCSQEHFTSLYLQPDECSPNYPFLLLQILPRPTHSTYVEIHTRSLDLSVRSIENNIEPILRGNSKTSAI
jgi:hypothetical protein